MIISLFFKLKEIVQLDLENMKARLEGVDSSNRLFLERELAVLAKQLSDFKTDFKSATASLKLRIQDLEAQNTKVTAVIETNTHTRKHGPCINAVFSLIYLPMSPETVSVM